MILSTLLSTCGLAVVVASSPVATRLTFDYGWRFQASATDAPTLPPTLPPTPAECHNLTKVFPIKTAAHKTYYGLIANRGATNAAECAEVCCAMGPTACFVWQWSDAKGCWAGISTDMYTSSGWIGAEREGKPPPSPPTPAPAKPGPQPLAMPVKPAESQVTFDDSKWRLLDLPHDYVVEQAYDKNTPSDQGPGRPAGGAGQSYLPRPVAYYRKHFALPSDWEGTTVWIHFEGVFRASKIWLNGVAVRTHAAFVGDASGESGGAGMGGGYTSFSARLDNCSAVKFGGANVLTVYTDPRKGSGWFYEGGGIYRKTYLHSAPRVRINTDGVYAYASKWNASSTISTSSTSRYGVRTAAATVMASVEVVNDGSATASTTVAFELFDASGTSVSTGAPAQAVSVGASSTSLSSTVALTVAGDVELWSVKRPYLYTLVTTLSPSGDSSNTSVGIYTTKWSGSEGFFMNEEHIKIRGFCNHESFGGVGMAIPDRVNLFRAQSLRSVGANGWRMSHNPINPDTYSILDRLGIVAMDESRILGTDDISIMNMGAMVKRDRNHPSIVIYSYCNEGGCHDGASGFRNITLFYDQSRPTLGNRMNFEGDAFTDVEGFSHKQAADFDNYNAAHPDRPQFASECCSCSTQRGTADTDVEEWKELSCTAEQSNRSESRPFMSGTMTWTLFDYYGESHGWPHVSSSYGQFDLAGFIKATGEWYRTFWLAAVPANDAGRPIGVNVVPYNCFVSVDGKSVLTEGTAQIWVNGHLVESAVPQPLEAAIFKATIPSLDIANVTVQCVDSKTGVPTLPAQRVRKASGATAMVFSIDAPSASMGTGEALVLDGHDVAMLRIAMVDGNGTLVRSSTANVTFSIVSGPGRVIASHNGDNACHESNISPTHSAFGGLVRGFVQVTEHRVGTAVSKALLQSIDLETAHTTVPRSGSAPTMINVMASSPGLKSVTIEIPVSIVEDMHGVLASATKSMES